MIKICKDFREVTKYKKLSLLREGADSVPILVLDNKLFVNARELFAVGHFLIEVKNDSRETLFYLKKYHDMIDSGDANVDVDINFGGCDLIKESNLDITLLNRSECFVFEEIEEYTYELIEYIKTCYPKVQIFCLDQNAKYFWENDEVTVLKSIYEINSFCPDKYMFICSDIKRHEQIIPEGISLIYNSENVMNSLCWARRVDHLGSKNIDKMILLIDMEFGKGCGLAYIVRTVCVFARMAFERGWVPVVNLTGDNMYIDSSQTNMWEQYFLPLSDISVEDALESQNVIRVKHNRLDYKVIHINPYFREIWGSPTKHPRPEFKKDIKEYFNIFMPREFCEEYKTLGAFIRGTDATAIAASKEEMDYIVSECQHIMEEKGFDKLFLATEDAVYFELFIKEFQNKLIYIDQKRVTANGANWKPIGELLNIKSGEKKNFGLTYLLVTNCLAKCQSLVYNIPSGGYYLANMWRGKPFGFSYHLSGETELDNMIRCLEMIEKNDVTAIYGTGKMGKRVLDILGQKSKTKIVFCDKKAENGEYLFERHRVIALSQLIREYEEKHIQGIIISTIIYREEIYQSLIMSGIDSEHILCIKDRCGIL